MPRLPCLHASCSFSASRIVLCSFTCFLRSSFTFFSNLPPTFSFSLLSYFPSLRPSIPVCLLFLHRPTSLFSTPASCRVIMSFRLCVLPEGKRNIRRSIPVLPRVPGQLVEISCTIVQPDSHSCPRSCLCFFVYRVTFACLTAHSGDAGSRSYMCGRTCELPFRAGHCSRGHDTAVST